MICFGLLWEEKGTLLQHILALPFSMFWPLQ